MRALLITTAAGVLGVALVSGCTSGTPAPVGSSAGNPATAGSAAATPTGAVPTAPIVAGPTTTAEATCPFLSLAGAMNDVGERIGRVTTSTSDGAIVGCAFYPISGTSLATSEHLPSPNDPIIAITTSRYADVTTAHNAMVELSQADPQAYGDPIPGADEAISFAGPFYAPDGTQDRAFTFRKGTTVALVRVAQTTPAFNARHIGTDIVSLIP